MHFKSIISVLILCFASALAQISPFFFGGGLQSGFATPFNHFGSGNSAQLPPNSPSPTNTGPVIFPPAPESRDTSGVVVGASGYGFVPPSGGSSHQRGLNSYPGFDASAFNHFFHI